jgi:hypothetical protein
MVEEGCAEMQAGNEKESKRGRIMSKWEAVVGSRE